MTEALPVPTDLPPDIGFLIRYGFEWTTLAEAAGLARSWDISAAEVVLATGLLSHDAFYRALAAELGLPFLEPGLCAHPLARFPEAIRSGISPLADGHDVSHALAPRGEAVAGLLERRGALVPGLAITTPAALRDAVLEARGNAVARLASEALPRERPEHSYHEGMSWPQATVILGLLLAISLAGLAAGRPALLSLIVLFGGPFLLLAAVKIAAVLVPAPIGPPPTSARPRDADLPIYTVLVPLHRESRVLAQLRGALLALDYPAARLDVKLLIEAGDRETKEAIATIDWPGFVEVVTVPPGEPRTKPRALNVGLLLARGRYAVVYDAEDVPEPGQLRDAAALFDRLGPEVACLQARLVIDNTGDGILTRFFTLEYGALFDVLVPALAQCDLPVPLGGTSNHLKTEILRALGGWDPWNVTEDADLGIRLALAGYRVADLPSGTHEEAPARLGAWLAQRARWMKGYVQVVITHSRRPARTLRDLGPWRFSGAVLLTAVTVLSAAIYPVFAPIVLYQIASGAILEHEGALELVVASLSTTLLGAGLLAMIWPALTAIRRRGWTGLLPFALLMPLYYLLVSVGAWRGMFELITDPDRWNKTEHGLARTSRSRGAGEETGTAPPNGA